MSDYEETGSVAAAPDVVFTYVSDIEHLTDYVPGMVLARPEGDRLHVAAEVQGRREEGPARFRADPATRRIEWGAVRPGQYAGWLQVSSQGEESAVTIHLSTDRDEDATEIRRSLSEALANIKSRLGSS